jgi:hypothetical protein
VFVNFAPGLMPQFGASLTVSLTTLETPFTMKPIYLTSVKAVSVVPSGGDKTDVRRENTDVRWVGFRPHVQAFARFIVKKLTKLSKRFATMEANRCSPARSEMSKMYSGADT